MKKSVWATLFTALFTWIMWYLTIPVLAWGFAGWIVLVMFATMLFFVFNMVDHDDFSSAVETGFGKTTVIIVAICVFLLAIVPIFNTWSAFHANSYRNLIGKVDTKATNTIMSPIDPNNIVIIDEETAHRIADKVLGTSDVAVGSESQIGDLTLQKVGDKLYYVAPLLHSGFFKWLSNGDRGTTGYVIVNATNDKDVRLIQSVNGEPVSIVYQPEACFGQNLERHIYMNGYKTVGLTDFSFEIDDSLRPYYVVTLYDNTIGYGGADVVGVLTVDVKTGEIKEYDITNAPTWIDRIFPSDMVETQIDDWGEFIHGWFNPSDKDRVVSTEGISIVYGDDGQCYFYTGISSVGKNQSSIGFMLVNSRTKEVHYYKQVGATESAAQQSAEGKVQEKGYRATHPRPYNVDGVWTYVMALKDKEGLIKAVALISVTNYEVVGVGEDIKSAIRDYKSALNSNGNAISASKKGESFSKKGKLLRISSDVKSGDTYYYMLVKGEENKIFVSTSSVSEELPLTLVGDSVLMEFDDAGNSFIDITRFDNLGLNPQKTKGQDNIEKYFNVVKDSISTAEVHKNTDAVWDTLSPKAKQELLKKINSK